MMNVLLRVSDAIDGFRQRAGRNVFWLALVAGLAAVLVWQLYRFTESSPVGVRPPVSRGEVRPAPPPALAIAPPPAPVVTAPPAPPPAAPAAPPAMSAPAVAPAPAAASSTAPAVAVKPSAPAKSAAAASPPKKAPVRAAPKPPPSQPLVLSAPATPPSAPPPGNAAASADPAPLYQVQLGAFAEEERAHRLAQRAAREGFAALVMPVTLAGGKVLHRVRLKDALPRSEAQALRSSVKQKIPALAPILVSAAR